MRTLTQTLIGFMPSFGVITLAPKIFYHIKKRNTSKALYLSLVWFTMLVFAVLAFSSAYSGLIE